MLVCVHVYTCRDARMYYMHGWMDGWMGRWVCAGTYACIHIHFYFSSLCPVWFSCSCPPLGCTIPALILPPVKSRLLPFPLACICQGAHTWHSCHCTSQANECKHLVVYFSVLCCDWSFKLPFNKNERIFLLFLFIFPRPLRIFWKKNMCTSFPSGIQGPILDRKPVN